MQAPLDRTADGPLSRLAAAPFVGRASLLEAVQTAFQGTRSGHGHALLLLGEAGIGKTRMADEITRLGQAGGVRPIGARCHEMQGAPALWPWIQVVRQLFSGLSPDARSALLGDTAGPLLRLLPELGQASPGDTSPRSPHDGDDRYRLFESLTTVLRRAASEAPLLVVLDDLHWADPASILLARYAVRELRRDPVIVVGLYRDTDVDPGDPLHDALGNLALETQVFRLEGLTPGEVARFAEDIAGFEVSSVLAAALHAQTGGNPLFLVEVLRLLASEGRLGAPDAPTPEAIPLPLTVRHTLQRRLDVLPPDTRTLLEQAALLGSEFDLEILEAALQPADTLGGALDEAIGARLLQRVSGRPGRFRFVHDLIREALDAGLSTADRAQAHRRTADAIAKTRSATLEDHYATLAHHYLESASTGTARDAVDFATLGAARASSAFSFELAVQLFELALRALDLLDAESGTSSESERTRVAILIDMGHSLWQSGQRSEARTTHLAAARLAQRLDDASLLAQAAIGLAGRNDVPMDFPDSSVQLMEKALAALSRSDSRLRVRLLAHLVRAKYFGDDRERLLAWAREAVAIATRLRDPGARFAALEALHYALLVPAHLEERLIVSKQLPELARETGSLRFLALAWLWRAFDQLQVPDIAAADAAIASFEEAARGLRQPFYDWLAAGLRATRAQMKGRLDEAERLVFRAFELGQRADSPNAFPFFGTQLFHLRVEQGRVDELMPVMQKIVDESPAQPVFRIGIPLIHALADRTEEARRSFELVAARDFEDVPHDLHRLPMLTSAAAVCAYLGDTRRAELLLRELRPEAGRIIIAGIATYWGGSIDRSLGQLEETLGRLDAAESHFAAAAEAAARAGARLLEAHTLSDRARVLRKRQTPEDTSRALEFEERAAAGYRELGVERESSAAACLAPRTRSTNEGRPPPERGNTARAERRRATGELRHAGGEWHVSFDGRTCRVPDSRGMHYLAALLERPGETVHVLDLTALVSPERRGGDLGEVLDPRARREIRARMQSLETEIEAAESRNDPDRATILREELQSTEEHLAAALGLGGRARRAGDPVERARKSVYNRVRDAIARIGTVLPILERHLQNTIRTGRSCSYEPEQPVTWRIADP